ncbi:hypothetical protein J2754_000440 [Halarchaeum solikamskense]|uniref:DUF7530 family protein n=1 Tax=Halarchaeum nitratireducens TaxID=489913 RepID=UPI001B3AC556|nr:hypothetical protein [Halarchaeum solikamskense]MBP2250143.1 hypothetical protein [Halarchaeum solikamskense]
MRDVDYGRAWTYESIVGAIPGVDVPDRVALAVQFALFEGAVLALAGVSDLWTAMPAATAAVIVATAGSALMLDLGRRLRRADLPDAYTHVVFGSSVETVLGVVAYVTLLTYLFVVDPRDGTALVTTLLGHPPSAPATFLALLVCWDVCYRIGVGWWAAVTALWRTLAFDLDQHARRAVAAADRRTAAFGLLQLLLVPFVTPAPLLVVAVVGHVVAVLAVLGVASMVR